MIFKYFINEKGLNNKSDSKNEPEVDKKSYVNDYFPESYQKEVLPIIEIIKPDDMSLSEYQEQVSQDLFESIKKREASRGRLISDPEEIVQEAKEVLVARLKSVLEDSRDYNNSSKKKLDKELVKKAKIALLYLNDNSDIRKYFNNIEERGFICLESLRGYIAGGERNSNKLTESDIDSLLKTKYRESLTSTSNDQMYYIGDYGNIESVSNSLMIGLAQAEEEDFGYKEHFHVINKGLKLAEKNKYSDECLEQLLSINCDTICLENSDKFSDDSIEKILRSGFSYSDRSDLGFSYNDKYVLNYLNTLGLSEEDYAKYLDLAIKHTIGYQLRQNFGAYSDVNGEVRHFLKETFDNLHQVEMDVNHKNDPENYTVIKKTVSDGYVGLALATPVCREYVEKYALDDYENFVKDISKHNQEHLVSKYLKTEDKIKYAEKLIDKGEEYLLVKFHRMFHSHSLGKDVFDKINEKELVTSLKGELYIFKYLSEQDALEFINRDRVNIFIKNIESFNLSREFLHTHRVQESALLEFRKRVFSISPGEAREVCDKIPFPVEKINDILTEAIKKTMKEERIDWACSVIKAFPEIKPLLKEEKFYKGAIGKLNDTNYPIYIADILECFPLPKENLNDEKIVLKIINTLSKNLYCFRGDNEKDKFLSLRSNYQHLSRISNFVKLPKYFIEFGEVIDRVENLEFKNSINIKIELLEILSKSENPIIDLDKSLILLEEINAEKTIGLNKELYIIYISKFLNNGNEVEKKEFFEKIREDIKSLARNEVADVGKDLNYYKYLLQKVYPQRNYNTYNYLDKYENLNHHLDKYAINRNGYDIKLSGLVGYKIKDGLEADQTLLDKFSKRVRDIKDLAKFDNLNIFLEKGIVDSKAQTIEGKILEYFKQNNYSVDAMNVLLAYQLLGSYDDFANASADRLLVETDKVSKDYILLDEIANQYGDNMKETIKTIHAKVVNSPDKELFSSDSRGRKEKKYQEVFLIISKDLNKIPKEKLNNEIINKKILKTIKNVFQGFAGIQSRANYFSSLFNVHNLDNFQELWSKHIDELFVIDDESSIDLSKIESLQSSIFNVIQNEINKYEEVKEVDSDRGESKLKKDRHIKGYFSKNKENAHARMVADVCIATDFNMLKNENYFEFVLFDQDKNKCVGTVMLLEMNEPEDNKKYLLYNPNPSVGLVSEVSAKKLYQLLTRHISKFAQDNNFDAVLVDKIHGKSTNRAGLFQQSLEQSCLKDENGGEINFNLKNNHSLGSSYSYQNNLKAVWIKD
jgi:hypothetical protein